MTSDWDGPRTYRREWITPPDLPDENMVEYFLAIFRGQPHIDEAWVVGSRMTPIDGSEARESSDVAIVFDPCLPDEERISVFMDLMQSLDAKGHGRGSGRGWLIVSPQVIDEHGDHATRIYQRSGQAA